MIFFLLDTVVSDGFNIGKNRVLSRGAMAILSRRRHSSRAAAFF
jgi:hypothetical protein